MANIGIQLYTVKEAASVDFLGTIRRVAKMGYKGVEFAGFFDTPSIEVKKVMNDLGIYPAGSHVDDLESLQGDKLNRTIEYHLEIGNDFIVFPSLPDEELISSADDYKRIAEQFNRVGEECNKNGVIFGYHNHAFEFEQFGEKTGFEILCENTDPKLVKMQLDCYWVTYGGYNPIEIIEKYSERIVSMHIKDMKRVEGMKRSVEFGLGELDIAGLMHVGDKFGAKWFIAEQEHFDGDPLDSAKYNIDRLNELYRSE